MLFLNTMAATTAYVRRVDHPTSRRYSTPSTNIEEENWSKLSENAQ
jgi:hypothetical protein